jgi:adenosylmethionine-8-amino-7-oxononanoate aminotransferase
VTDDIICLAPPLVITEEEVDQIASIVHQAIANTTGI